MQNSVAPSGRSNPQPLLRWAGSKKRQFAELSQFFPDSFSTYIEPFAGSAAFLFRLGKHKAKINDLNQDLVDFYRNVKTHPNEIYGSFLKIPRNSETYYRVRLKYNSMPRGQMRSVYFYYLNRNCFNGIYRTNNAGQFNVPFSDNRVSPYLSRDEFRRSCEAISRTTIHNKDFEVFCRSSVGRGDFVFLDPPYYRDASRMFAEYGASSFDRNDFSRLADTLKYLDRVGATFLMSFPKTKNSVELAKRWNSTLRYVRRTVAGNPSARRKQSEMLIYNYDLR